MLRSFAISLLTLAALRSLTRLRSLTALLLMTVLLSITALLGGCSGDKVADTAPATPAPEAPPRTRASEAKAMPRAESPAWPVGQAYLDAGLAAARELQAAVDRLLVAATIGNLEAAQGAWRKTAAQLEQFHLFTRLGAAAPEQFQGLADLQFNLSAWPIQPGYLDSYGAHPYSGIVFDVGMPITEEALRGQHGMTDGADATLGLYAMEFLLFGEQNSRGPLVFQPITALNEKDRADGYQEVAELPRNRRRELLRLQAQILLADLTQLQALWANPQPGQPRYKFEIHTPPQQLELLRAATLILATEQLVALANLQKPANSLAPGNNLWQNQQFAERLRAQLQGLQQLHQTLNLGAAVEMEVRAALTALGAVAALPPITDKGQPTQVNWQDTYTALRGLVRALDPTAAEAVPPEGAPAPETPAPAQAP